MALTQSIMAKDLFLLRLQLVHRKRQVVVFVVVAQGQCLCARGVEIRKERNQMMICIIDLKRIVSLLPIAASNLDFLSQATGSRQHWLERMKSTRQNGHRVEESLLLVPIAILFAKLACL